MRVVYFGAGGPVAAGGIRDMEGKHQLRLTDLKELDTPHEFMAVDITDYDQVRAAVDGMDAVINCTVNRTDEVLAFDVNVRGAYNVFRAAIEAGVPRVVHTGPGQIFSSAGGYNHDWEVSESVPPRPGHGLYATSKFLAHELAQDFCRHHPELSVVAFYYSSFHSETPQGRQYVPVFAVHYDDAGQAFRLACEVPREKLPHNFEHFNICADLPHHHISIEKAKRLLGYQPRYNFDELWRRSAGATAL